MLKQKSSSKGIQEKIGKALAHIPLSPNHWTVFALIIAGMGAFSIAFFQDLLLGLFFFVFAGVLDMVDGAVARARNEATKFGAFLDGVSDRFMEFLFLFAFLFYPLPELYLDPKIWIAALIFLGACIPAYIRSYAAYNGVISPEKAKGMGGLFERSERILLLSAGLAAGIAFSMEYFIYAIILSVALSAITVLQRIYIVYSNREEESH